MSVPPDVKVFRETDGDTSALTGKTVAILGYGQVGRPLALNLRDGTPAEVIIGDSDDSALERAVTDGFAVHSVAEATSRADLVLLLVPDEVQPTLFRDEVAPCLRAGGALAVASGYNLAFGGIEAPANIDVLL